MKKSGLQLAHNRKGLSGPGTAACLVKSCLPIASVLITGLILLGWVAASRAASDVHCTPAQFWSPAFGTPPQLSFVRDVDGDGYADLVALSLKGAVSVEVSLNADGQKPCYPHAALDDFGRDAAGGTVGEFAGNQGADVMTVFPDGTIRLAWNFNSKENRYDRAEVVGHFPSSLAATGLMAAGDVQSNGRDDAILVEPAGDVWQISLSTNDTPKATVTRLGSLGTGVSNIAIAGRRGRRARFLVYEQGDGSIVRRRLSRSGLGCAWHLLRTKSDTPFLIANLAGNGPEDLVVGDTVYWRCSAWRTSHWKELDTSLPGILVAGDVNQHGRDDLIRFKRMVNDPDPYTENDVFLHTTYRESDPDWDFDGLTNEEEAKLGTDPRNRDTDNDGLLDGWEVKGYRGFDLAKLGCSPLHQDVLCEIKRFDTVRQEDLDKTIASLKKFYANLPVTNLDGKAGIHFIALQPKALTPSQGEGLDWGAINARFCPPLHHGVAHWMSVTPGGGGGQSSQMGDAGGCADGWAVFAHEFGHQLGLPHDGFWNVDHCPIYTSLMNYVYSYSFDGKPEAVHYSHGKFKSLVLNETNLSEVLPCPYADVEFLSRAPYHFHLQPAGTNTLIDWNWNGVFGEQHVRADINYGYSTTAGFRNVLDTTRTSPFLFTRQTNELLMVYGKEPAASAPGADYVAAPTPAAVATNAEAGNAGNTTDLALVLRRCSVTREWMEPVVIEPRGMTGDPSAVADGNSVWVFYPMAAGVCYREITEQDGAWHLGPRATLPDSQGRQATPGRFHDRLYVFLRKDGASEIQAIYQIAAGWSQPQSLGFTSTIPVGAAVDPIRDELLIGCAKDQDEKTLGHWQVRRFTLKPDDTLAETSRCWVGTGDGSARSNARLSVLFNSGKEAGPAGKLRIIGRGYIPPRAHNDWAGLYVAEQIPDATVNGGWLIKHYYDEWTNSRSAPGAVAFNGDIAVAYRWVGDSPAYRDNQIHLGYSGMGIDDAPMGDFDDVDFISRIGLHRSIGRFSVRQP